MSYLVFASRYRRALTFGLAMTAVAGVGQTFLIALFVPSFLEEFSLNKAQFGSLYSMATLASAFSLAYVGKFIDDVSLRRYALIVGLGLVAACASLSLANSIVVLVVSLWAIRLTGQGLCTHVAATAMGRYFGSARGKALSLSGLGYSFAEALLPMLTTALILNFGWRSTWQWIALAIFCFLLPTIALLLKRELPYYEDSTNKSVDDKVSQRQWTRKEVIRSPQFMLWQPLSMAPACLLTGLFLYHLPLAESKGWTTEWIATAFMAFAVARFAAALIAGPLVDRYGARILFGWHVLPLLVAFIILAFFDHWMVAPIYLGLAGLTVGFGGNFKNALFAELYGITHLGAIRSLGSMLVVFGTAIGPILLGGLLDAGLNLSTVLLGFAFATLIITLIGVAAIRSHKDQEILLSQAA